MIRNTLIIRGARPKAWAKLIKRSSHFETQAVMMDLAEWALNSMRSIIANKKKRASTTKLEDALTIESVGGFGAAYFEIGVGNIELLNTEAEYWQVLNSGFTRSGQRFLPYMGKSVPYGEFSDGGGRPVVGASGGTWLKGSGNYTFKAKKFIEPTNYIDITMEGLRTNFWTALTRIEQGLATGF